MKREKSLSHISRGFLAVVLMVFACFAAGRAEVIPRVCVNTTFQSGTTTLAANVGAGATPDFDGAPLNVYTGNGGNPPTLPYRCVYYELGN